MKKFLSALIVAAMLMGNFPQLAGAGTAQMISYCVSYDMYTDISQLTDTYIMSTSHTEYSIFDGTLQIKQIKTTPFGSDGGSNSSRSGGILIFPKIVVSEDTKNKTVTYTDCFGGNVEVVVDFTANVDNVTSVDGKSVTGQFYDISVGHASSTDSMSVFTQVRNYTDYCNILNNTSVQGNTMPLTKWETNGNGQENQIKFIYDIVNKKQTVTVNGREDCTTEGEVLRTSGSVNAIRILGMDRMGINSVFNLKSISVKGENNGVADSLMEKALALPDKLADNPDNVTENVIVPEIDGVTWTTSDSSIMLANGRIKRVSDKASGEVVLTASVTDGISTLKKDYKLTVNTTVADTDAVFGPTDDDVFWYTQPMNEDGTYDPYGYPIFDDPQNINDAVFFGTWDFENNVWSRKPYLRYEDYPGLSSVEAAAKNGDYETAKDALLEYYKGVMSERVSSPSTSIGSNYELYYELMIRNAYAVGREVGDAMDMASVSNDFGTVSFDVNKGLTEAKGTFTQLSFLIAGIDKYKTQAEIYSRNSAYAPVLKATVNGVERTFPCIKDSMIRAGQYADTNYGSDEIMTVEESGSYQNFDDRTKRVFMAFDISSLSSDDVVKDAKVIITARTNSARGYKELLCYWYKNESWTEDEVTWNYFSDQQYFSENDKYCWNFVTPSNTALKGKICGYHRGSEPTFLVKLYSHYKNNTEVDAEKYAYTYLRQYMALLNGVDADRNVMNELDMSNNLISISSAVYALIDSEHMNGERFTAFLKHNYQLADYLSGIYYGKGYNNWATYATGAVYIMCIRFPECANRDLWFERTKAENDRLLVQQGVTFDDGMCIELGQGYVKTLLGTFSQPINAAEYTGDELPYGDTAFNIIHDCVMTLINMSSPIGGFNLSDSMDAYSDSYKSIVTNWWKWAFSDDEVITYVATDGKMGKMPDNATSHYPYGLRTFMRSDWSEDALAMSFTSKGEGSHGHKDQLSISMVAYGKFLLTDQSYGAILTGNIRNYMISPVQHNVVTVNDTDDYMNTGIASSYKTQTAEDGREVAFETNSSYDYIEYSTGANTATRISQRGILFMKNQKMWIVTDYNVPNDNTVTNLFTQHWHMYPESGISDDENKILRSNFSGEANVIVAPVSPDEIDSVEYRNTYYSEKSGQLRDSKKAMYNKSKTGNCVFSTIIIPENTDEKFSISTQKLNCGIDEDEVNSFSFTVTDDDSGEKNLYYYYHINNPELKKTVTVGKYTTDADTMLVEEDEGGNIKSVYMMGGTFVRSSSLGELVHTDSNIQAVSVDYCDGVSINSSVTDITNIAGLETASFGNTVFTLNGKEITAEVNGGTVSFANSNYKDEFTEDYEGTLVHSLSMFTTDEIESKISYYKCDSTLYNTEVSSDGIKFENIGTIPYIDGVANGNKNFIASFILDCLTETDSENGTAVYSHGLSGKYAVELDLKQVISTQRSTSTYDTIEFGKINSKTGRITSPMLTLRVAKGGKLTIVIGTNSQNYISNIGGFGDSGSNEYKLKFVFDTVNKTYSMYINDMAISNVTDLPWQYASSNDNVLPDIQVTRMDATDAGSYLLFKDIKVYEIERNTSDARYIDVVQKLAQLPVNLMNLTDNAEFSDSAVWETSDSSVITNSGTITPGIEEKSAKITATIKSTVQNQMSELVLKNIYDVTVSPAAGWTLNCSGLQNSSTSVSVSNSSGIYTLNPVLIIAAYDSFGKAVDLIAVNVTEEINNFVWNNIDASAVSVKAYLWTGISDLTPLIAG